MRRPRPLDRAMQYVYRHRVATHIWLFGLATFFLAVLR